MRAVVMTTFFLTIFVDPGLGWAQANSVLAQVNKMIISGRNAPLGLSLPATLEKFPMCYLQPSGPEITNQPFEQLWLPPLTGYDPPFPDLTPVGPNGEYFTVALVPGGGNIPVTLAVLDWNMVNESMLSCGSGGDVATALLNDQEFDLIVYDKKILAVATYLDVKNVSNYRSLLETIMDALPGRRGPTHFGVDPDFESMTDPKPLQMPVYVSFVDNAGLRVIAETEGSAQNGENRDPRKADLDIAYVNLSLWHQYVLSVEADLASPNDSPSTERPPSSLNDSPSEPILPLIPIQIENHSGN